MQHPYYQQATFSISATTKNTLPPELGFEVVFAGRSNAGKSSVINRVCGQKSLARTSKTPGRTQLINFFSLPEGRSLVDLPGYGYAKVPEATKIAWGRFIDAYLMHRFPIRGLILIMDIRHPMKETDQKLLSWGLQRNMPIHVILNKSDKLKRGAAKNTLLSIRKHLQTMHPENFTVQTFSALNGEGLETLWDKLDQWLMLGDYLPNDEFDDAEPFVG